MRVRPSLKVMGGSISQNTSYSSEFSATGVSSVIVMTSEALFGSKVRTGVSFSSKDTCG